MKEKKYLGIDWGESRIGLAIGDNDSKVAIPFKTVFSLDEVLKISKEEEISEIILGQPIKMSGEEKKLNPQFLQFEKDLKEKSACPVKLFDERLTSKAGDRLIGDKKTKATRDEIAATIILQDYLDQI